MRRLTIVIAASILLAGSASALERVGPTWSEVTGNLFPTAQMHRMAAVVSSVDGDSTKDRIVKITPGKHVVVMRSPMREGTAGTDMNVDMNFEPCKRYYINAQFKSKMGRAWEPVVAQVEAVPGCKVPGAS